MKTLLDTLLDLYAGRLGAISTPLADKATPRSATFSGDFSLSDSKACGACAAASCDHITMNVRSDTPVSVTDLSQWIDILPPKVREGLKNCDFLFYDAEDVYGMRRIALCDLSCSDPAYIQSGKSNKYPEGKREYVVKQMLSIAQFISDDAMLDHLVATATSRRMVFGLRETSRHTGSGAAARAMRSFMRTPSSTALSLTASQHIAALRFEYVEVRYPEPFRW